ncbi:MAG TPA: hypothetical protein PK581_04205 [Caldisericia bacterium]|nr:hypothetical protein [Caldisericia bacterium]
MIITKLNLEYDIKENFPNAKCVRGWEGGGAYYAVKDSIHYLIIDERTMAGFMDENDPDDKMLIDKLLHLIQFDNEEEFKQYLEEELSWAVNMEDK